MHLGTCLEDDSLDEEHTLYLTKVIFLFIGVSNLLMWSKPLLSPKVCPFWIILVKISKQGPKF